MVTMCDKSEKKKTGFAVMNKERVREIASMGGKAAHESGVAHRFTSEEAKTAGRKGGLAYHAKRRALASGDNTGAETVIPSGEGSNV